MANKADRRCLALGLGLTLFPLCSHATLVMEADDFAALSLEELANLEISSVSRKKEPLSSAAAAIFVITGDDIRRNGFTSLPEALRLAPNLQVARISAGSWAISARGFNSSTANKLLVLIDGRPVYTPLYSGVFWDAQDVFMPDVERIEVISGPNATTWGSNAVNGVINVVTRSAARTTGAHVALGAGSQEQVYQARVGDATEGGAHYRVYGKHFAADATEDADGNSRDDAFDRNQVGFRLDAGGERDDFALHGDIYDGTLESGAGDDSEIAGMNLRARWSRTLEGGSSIRLAGFYDRTERKLADLLDEHLDVLGLELNHQFQPSDNHALTWGVDVRHARDHVANGDLLAFLPERKDLSWTSVYAQDDIRLGDDFSVSLGARAEDNSYTGIEFMPNARFSWALTERHHLWASVSRAVRTPSRIDREFFVPAEPPFLLTGGADFESEVANVVELGYRAQPTGDLSWSLTAFHHDYDRLRSLEIGADGVVTLGNGLRGTGRGAEGWLTYQPLPAWRLGAGFFVFDKDLELRPDSTAVTANEGNDPSRQWQLRSSHELSDRGALEIFVRHVDDLPDPEVPAYTSVDANLIWRIVDSIDVSLRVNNLLDEEHAEFGATGDRTEFGRQTFLQMQWSYP